jgi:hypothetical protein
MEVEEGIDLSEESIRRQLDLLSQDQAFSTSKRSVAFLRYVVDQTLLGSAELLKERTIGVDVFGRDPSYDTGSDHIVRTSATELRKRLAIYYGDEKHKSELRIGLLPGSYIPKFALPVPENDRVTEIAAVAPEFPLPAVIEPIEPEEHHSLSAQSQRRFTLRYLLYLGLAVPLVGFLVLANTEFRAKSPRTLFWSPVLRVNAPVLIAVGDVPKGPPSASDTQDGNNPPSPKPGEKNPPTVPFADAVTIAKVSGVLTGEGKQVVIRRENSSSFSDLRERPVVLIGAFNNEWSLHLTHPLRFSLAMDAAKRIIYIRDQDHPESRQWSWGIDPHEADPNRVNSAALHDYALISRIESSETGQVVVIIGGLYIYGTQAAGEFLSDPQLMSLTRSIALDTRKNLQIVLETDVTQETAGPPRIVAVSSN